MDFCNSKLAYFIRLIPSNERPQLTSYLSSPFFKVSQKSFELYKLLEREISAERNCSEQLAMDLLFGNRGTSDRQKKRLSKLQSELTGHVLDFMIYQSSHDTLPKSVQAVKAINHYGGVQFVEGYYKKASQQMSKQDAGSSRFLHLFQLELEWTKYLSTQAQFEGPHLQRAYGYLERYFFMVRLRLLWALKARGEVLDLSGPNISDEELQELAHRLEGETDPDLGIILKVNKIMGEEFEGSNHEGLLEQLCEDLAERGPAMDTDEAAAIYHHCINFCIRRVNLGESQFLDIYLKLYKGMAAQHIIPQGGALALQHFKNIIRGAVKAGRADWALEVIQNQKIEDPLLLGILWFHLGRTVESLRHLRLAQSGERKGVFYELASRAYQLMAMMELGEVEILESVISSAHMYVHRNRFIPTLHRKGYKLFFSNVHKLFRELYGRSMPRKSKLQAIHRTIEQGDHFVHRKWILDKLAEKIKVPEGRASPDRNV